MIIVQGRELLIPNNERYIGTNYDTGMENRLFRIPRYSQSGTDLSDLVFKINLIFDGDPLDRAEMAKEIDDDYIYLTWAVTAEQVAVTGTVFVCITGNDTNDTVKWSTFQAAFYTEKSIGDDIDTAYHNLVNRLDAEATTRQNVDNTLQQNINAEAAARAAGDEAANARIDNIVAQSGDDNTEIVDARVGADGTTYTVLKNRLDAEHNNLKSQLSFISYQLSRLPWEAPYTLTDGSYVSSAIRAAENVFVYMKAGTRINFSAGYVLRYALYSAVDFNVGVNQFTFESESDFLFSPVIIPSDGYYRFAVGLENATAITVEQAASMFLQDYPMGLSVASNVMSDILASVAITRGLTLSSTGTVDLSLKGAVTDYIEVSAENLYTLKLRTKTTSETFSLYSRIIAYDKNRDFISVIGRQAILDNTFPDKDIILTIPNGCEYIRISYPYLIVDAYLECYTATDQKVRILYNNQNKSITTLKAEKYALKRNNTDMIRQMVMVANSYKDQQAITLEYGTTTPLSVTYNANAQSHHYIDCSTFIGFVLRGIPFEDSPYLITYPANELYEPNVRYFDTKQFTANPDYAWAIDPSRYEYDLFQDVSYPQYAEARRASQICQMMAEQGRDVPNDKYMANIAPGDLLFFSRKDANGDYIEPTRFRCVTHVALVIDVSDAPQDASWNTSLYPYMHTYIEVSGGGSPVKVKVLEEQTISPTVNSIASLSCVMRPDLGAISAPIFDGKQIIFHEDGTVTWTAVD